jgi:hypothetical protein
MVLLQAEIQKTVAERTVTKVNDQPTSNDLDLLEEEFIAIAASIPMVLGGGLNGHAGMLLSDVDYATMAPGIPLWLLSILVFIQSELLQQIDREWRPSIKSRSTSFTPLLELRWD